MDIETKEKVNLCLKGIRRQDENAYVELHSLIGGRIRLIAMKYIKNQSDVEDLIQDFWLEMDHYAMKSLLVSNSFAYLMKIFENMAKAKYNKDKKHKKNVCFDDLDYFCSDDINIEQDQLDGELNECLRKTLKSLEIEEKSLFEMHFIKAMTLRQIAKQCGFSKNKVAKDILNLIGKIKKALIANGYDVE